MSNSRKRKVSLIDCSTFPFEWNSLALDQRSEVERVVTSASPLQLRLSGELPRRERLLLVLLLGGELPSALLRRLLGIDADLLLRLGLATRRGRSGRCAFSVFGFPTTRS